MANKQPPSHTKKQPSTKADRKAKRQAKRAKQGK